ncbi:hypothetical protein QTL91_24395, partial [Salmonella enterica subsp. enterica serovar Typhimurium]|nr:hypothetical protein [Salmonella enterica subsp. enterica serovar Typhimurium]
KVNKYPTDYFFYLSGCGRNHIMAVNSTGSGYAVCHHGILSFLANGLFLVSMVRATRLIGNASDQGKLFGFLESGRGIAVR